MFRYNQNMPPEINQCKFSKAMYKPLKPIQLNHNWSLSLKTSVGHQTNSVKNQISDNVWYATCILLQNHILHCFLH